MTDDVTLQSLIDRIKGDLFAPYHHLEDGQAKVPVFFVEEAELEVAFNVSYDDRAGVRISILQVVSGGTERGTETGSAHRIKVKLCPILTREELREIVEKDDELMASIRQTFETALRSRFLGDR